MTPEEFKKLAYVELANNDARRLAEAIEGELGTYKDGIDELLRWGKANEAFPNMSVSDMWETDRQLSGGGKLPKTKAQYWMSDPVWAALEDLQFLKGLWRKNAPGRQVPLDLLSEIAANHRHVSLDVVVSRRGRSKDRRP